MKFYKVMAVPGLLYGSECWSSLTDNSNGFNQQIRSGTRKSHCQGTQSEHLLFDRENKQNYFNHISRMNMNHLPQVFCDYRQA